MTQKMKIMLAFIIGAVLLGALVAGPIMSDVEQPKYEIVAKFPAQNIEIRQYDPTLIAEVSVDGAREEAISEGFKQLADYIFGNNIAENKISMTAPVVQKSAVEASQSIAMTAPVTQKPLGKTENGQWSVNFTMPNEYTINNIPKPRNKNISLKEMPSKTMVAIEFSGRHTDENLSEHRQKVTGLLTKKNITPLSEASFAFYNPPWTIPPLRRNEVLYEISAPNTEKKVTK